MIALLFFSFLFTTSSFAKEVILPKPTGVYSVGTQMLELKDKSRQMLRDPTPRRWLVQAFYPSQTHEGLFPYMLGTLEDGQEVDQWFKVYKTQVVHWLQS